MLTRTQGAYRFLHVLFQLVKVMAADIFQACALHILPYTFIWIEIGRISGKELQVYSFTPTSGQIFLHILAPMDCGAVPYNQELTRNVLLQMFQKLDYIWPLERVILELNVEPLFSANRADC